MLLISSKDGILIMLLDLLIIFIYALDLFLINRVEYNYSLRLM